MILKTNLHLHTRDDPKDRIQYSFEDALNEAQRLGIGALALTCHNKFIDNPEYRRMAEERGILYIPGIERSVNRRHVVILNGDSACANINSFEELAAYKATHPDIFILAPHPYYKTPYCLGRKLKKYKDIFDAIEFSWFYTKHVDLNKKAARFAKEQNIPYVSTSDLHDLRFMHTSYANVEVDEMTIPALFAALRNRKFTNTSSPRRLFRELIPYFFYRVLF